MNEPGYDFERDAIERGFQAVAGIDEAGRGAVAGPVVAACVILNTERMIEGLRDSKKLSPGKREEFFVDILVKCEGCSVGIIEADVVDEINILNATKKAMVFSALNVRPVPRYLLIDALRLDRLNIPQKPIVKGDERSVSIAAASILAKVTRDRIMKVYGEMYPRYNFQKNKGYGTPEHLSMIRRHGPSPVHRKTFRGVREYCGDQLNLWSSAGFTD